MTVAAHGGAARHVTFERERGVYRVDVTQDLAHVVVPVGAETERTDRLLRVFRTLADADIPIFLIKLHRAAVSFAIEAARLPEVETCLRRIGFDCSIRLGLALLTIVATNMRDLTGVMVSIADSLTEAGARLYGVGDSHNSVQCLIEGAHVDAARKQIWETFGLEDAG